MSSLDPIASKFLKEKGMQQAIDNAERKDPEWREKALQYVRDFPKDRFMAEEVRDWAHSQGLVMPPHARAWGAVIVAAARKGIIRKDGYSSVANPKAHSTPAAVWVKQK